MRQTFRENGGAPEFEPISPGLALKIIFENNMGMTLERVSNASGISLSTLKQITDEGRSIDKETGEKLKSAFGDTGTTLVRMQFAFDFFRKHGALPPPEQIYSI